MKRDVDIRKDLYTKVVLSDSVAMLQGRDQMTKECNVSYADDFFVSVTVSVEVSLGTKLAQLRESVRMHTDLTLLHSCTFVCLVTELLCALDHSLAQVAPQNRLPLDMIAER